MLDRIIGVVTLKPATYRQIADDPNQTTPAAIIVVIFAILGGILGAVTTSLITSGVSGAAGVPAPVTSPIGTFVSSVINAIIGWLVGGWVFAFVSTTFFGGKTNTGEMLRVFGFTQVFQILNVIPCIGWIAALVLSVIGAIIGIREASEFDTTKAILTGLVGFVILVIVSIIIGAVLGVVGL